MFNACYDESFDDDRSYVIAGYVGEQENVINLHWKWEKHLRKLGLPYFKASECEFGFGPFAQYRDDPDNVTSPLKAHEKQRLGEIKKSFVDLAESEKLIGIGVGVLKPHFNQLISTNPKALQMFSEHPYYICYQWALMEAGIIANNRNKAWRSKYVLAPIFDSHEECSGRAKQMYERFKAANPVSSQWLIDTLTYANDGEFLAIQAADNLAYEIRKFINNIQYDASQRKRIAWERMKQRVYRVYSLDLAALEMIVNQNLPLLDERTLYSAEVLKDYEI